MKVFISSGYSGDVDGNVRRQMDAANVLMNLGYIPFMPLLVHFHDQVHKREYSDWLKWCMAWIEDCDCVLRLPGESSGADAEVARAKELGIPVFFSIPDIVRSNGKVVSD